MTREERQRQVQDIFNAEIKKRQGKTKDEIVDVMSGVLAEVIMGKSIWSRMSEEMRVMLVAEGTMLYGEVLTKLFKEGNQ